MDFRLTDEQKALRDMVRDFAAKEIAPHAEAFDEQGAIPKSLLDTMAELGLMGVCVPPEYGGAGMDYLAYIIALEEVCKASASVGLAMTVNNTLYGDPLMRFGMPEQKTRWLGPAARGERLGCYCLTEPGSGSDAMALATTAVPKGDGFLLNGTKLFITNGQIASYAIVFATVDKSKGYKGVTAFLVDKATPGFSVGKKERKMGLLASDTCELILENVRVGADQVLGKVGEGYKVAFSTLDAGRIGIAAQSLGIADACLDCGESLCQKAIPVRQTDRRIPSHSMDARGHGDRDRGGALVDVSRRYAEGRGASALYSRGLDGQALRLRNGEPRRLARSPDLRRIRIYQRLSRGTLFPGRPRDAALRRNIRDPAARDCARAAEGSVMMEDRKPRFTSLSGLPIDRLYAKDDLKNWATDTDLGASGEFPYTRGVYPTMYRGRLWTMRQFAGFGTAEDTNKRFKYLLDHGQTGLSVAFDMPTLMGLDADDPRARGEVGYCGVAISSLADMERLFEGIPLEQVTTSMTINGPAAVLFAMYLAVAERRGIPFDRLGGTLQNDILKEYIAQKEWLFPPEPSLRLITDTMATARNMHPNGIRSASAAITSARPARRRFRNWPLHSTMDELRRCRSQGRTGRGPVRASAFVLLQRSQRLFRGDRQISGGAQTLGA